MEYVGLFFEIFLLVVAIYIYLFAIGKVTTKDEKLRQKAEDFRKDNHWWMRLGALALIAILVVNLFLHVRTILS